MKLKKERILKIIFRKKLMTPEEYETKYKGKYIDQCGFDSFMTYLSYVAEFSSKGRFLTTNEKIYRDREKLEKKFGIEIITMEDI